MVQSGVQIVNTSLVQVGSNVVSAKYNGGWGVLVLAATQYAPTVNLVLIAGNGNPIKINSTNLQADSITPFQFPAGTYAIHSAGGSSIGIVASICPTS